MLISSSIPISVVEQTIIAGVVVKLYDSILTQAIDVAEYVIMEILPYAVIGILILAVIIVMVEFILRLFR